MKFHGGCDGNLNAVCKLSAGQTVDHVAYLLEGNTCHRYDDTSCADQMVKALNAARASSSSSSEGIAISRRQFACFASIGALTVLTIGLPKRAFADSATQTFTDSFGRKVEMPSAIDTVVPLGEVAQCLVCTLCPEALASVASKVEEGDKNEYYAAGMGRIVQLPETGGGASGGVETVDAQKAAQTGATIMIDIGLPKDGLTDELDKLQVEGGVPCAFLDVSFGNLPQAYRSLGDSLFKDASSLDRIWLTVGDRVVILSVKDKAGFLRMAEYFAHDSLGQVNRRYIECQK